MSLLEGLLPSSLQLVTRATNSTHRVDGLTTDTEAKIITDSKARNLLILPRIKKRRWRHKITGQVIKRDFSFMADGSKFTRELSDFLKDASGYATRYHEQHSELLWGG